MMKKVLIFDFDGTLVDTVTDVGLCFNEALKQYGFPQHPLKNFDRFVGGNLETVVSGMLPERERTEENISKVKTLYRRLYLASDKPHSKPYPGVEPMLFELHRRGYRLAINSNKGQTLLDSMVEALFPAGTFDSVVGYDEARPSKPDPYGVDMICAQCGCTRRDAVYIGDGESDLNTAKNAEIPFVYVTWGQGKLDIGTKGLFSVRSTRQLYEYLITLG